MSTDPSDPLAPSTDPDVVPSSTPDGPQTIPAPDTPAGEPGPDPSDASADPRTQPGQLDEPTRGSNPNSGGPAGLAGDMGISSERTGPAGSDPRGFDIEGTGSVGGSVTRTDGGFDTSPTEWDAVDVSQRDVNPMPEGSETMTGAGSEDTAYAGDDANIDRTVGEPMPNPIPDEKLRRGNDQPDASRAQ
jgi:hypothetical protein